MDVSVSQASVPDTESVRSFKQHEHVCVHKWTEFVLNSWFSECIYHFTEMRPEGGDSLRPGEAGEGTGNYPLPDIFIVFGIFITLKHFRALNRLILDKDNQIKYNLITRCGSKNCNQVFAAAGLKDFVSLKVFDGITGWSSVSITLFAGSNYLKSSSCWNPEQHSSTSAAILLNKCVNVRPNLTGTQKLHRISSPNSLFYLCFR